MIIKNYPLGKVLLYFVFIIFPLGQIGRLFKIGEINILLNDVVVFLVVLTLLLKILIRRQFVKWEKTEKYLGLFIVTAVISILVNLSNYSLRNIGIGSLYLIRFCLYSLLFLVIKEPSVNKEKITGLMIKSVIVAAIIGFIQYFFFPDLSILTQFGWDPHYYRLAAPFFDTSFTGAILVLGSILLTSLFWEKKYSWRYLLPFLFLHTAIALTYSRGAYGMYLIGIIVIAVIKKAPQVLLLFIGLCVLTLILLPQNKGYGTNLQRGETISARIKNWQNSLVIWKDYPFFGVGFNTYKFTQEKYHFVNQDSDVPNNAASGADSSLLFVLATTGIVGFIAYILLGLNLLKLSFKTIENPLSLALFASIIALLFHSLFANSLFYPWIMEWIWILVGLRLGKI